MTTFYQSTVLPVKTEDPWDEHRLGWLALASFDGFGCRTLTCLSEYFRGRGDTAWKATKKDLNLCGVSGKLASRFADYRTTTDPSRLAKQLERERIRFLLHTDSEYPSLLREIHDAPFALFQRGAPFPASLPCLTVVGTRGCTVYGKRVVGMLCRELAALGVSIASGLALGIDAYAHEAALTQNGYTIAVLGSGNEDASIYPRQNFQLAQQILTTHGTLLSEFPPGTPAFKPYFPLRNRILSGLSKATLVIEATPDSGSLITARFALEQNREVLAVPGPITNEQSQGTNALLRRGAIPCTSIEDVLEVLQLTRSIAPHRIPDLSAEERRLLEALTQPLHIDELARTVHLAPPQLSALVTELECKELIECLGGKMYARSTRWKPTTD